MAEVQIKKKRTFKKYTFRGVDLDQLLNLKTENLVELLGCRQRRHYARASSAERKTSSSDFELRSELLTPASPEPSPLASRLIFDRSSSFPRWLAPLSASTTERFSTKLKSSPKGSVTIWPNFRCLTSQFDTAVPVLERPTLPDSSHSSKKRSEDFPTATQILVLIHRLCDE